MSDKKKLPALTLPQAQFLIGWALAVLPFSLEELLAVLKYRQQRNWAAYCSHRQRRLRQHNQSLKISYPQLLPILCVCESAARDFHPKSIRLLANLIPDLTELVLA